MKINVVKVLSIVGTVLSLGGSLVSTIASNKETKELVGKLVEEKLAGK